MLPWCRTDGTAQSYAIPLSAKPQATEHPPGCRVQSGMLTLALCAVHLAALRPITLDVGGVKRELLAYTPESPAKAPIVFVFHGHGGTGRSMARRLALHQLWPEAVVLYPQGLPTAGKFDPEGNKAGWQKGAGAEGDRDLKFFDAMLAELQQRKLGEPAKVFVTGHSNGWLHVPALGSAGRQDRRSRTLSRGRQRVRLEAETMPAHRWREGHPRTLREPEARHGRCSQAKRSRTEGQNVDEVGHVARILEQDTLRRDRPSRRSRDSCTNRDLDRSVLQSGSVRMTL